MPARVTELSDAQRATFAPYVREWVERANRPGPLTDDDRAAAVEGIRACYEAAGRPWHGNVAWAGSPYTAKRAVHAAAWKIHAHRQPAPPEPPPQRFQVWGVLSATLVSGLVGLGAAAVLGALAGGTVAATRAYIHVGGAAAIAGAAIAGGFALVALLTGLSDEEGCLQMFFGAQGVALFTVIGAATGAWLAGETIPFPGSAVVATGRTWAVVAALVGAVAGLAIGLAVARSDRPPAPARAPRPHPPPADPTADAIRRATLTAVTTAVEAAVGDAVRAEVDERVQRPIRAATGTLPAAVDLLIANIENSDFDDDFGEVPEDREADAVAARIASGAPPAPMPVEPGDGVARSSPYAKMLENAAGLAAAGWLRDHADLELPGDLWARADAYLAANRAGPWWPTADFAVVSEPPVERHLDAEGRPHRSGGPALRWSDGLTGWFTHGDPEYRPGRPTAFSDPGL